MVHSRRTIFAVAALATVAFALPAAHQRVPFPPGNGFPTPSADRLIHIGQQAHGPLPNGLLPQTLSAEGVTNLKLIASNEFLEVAFFTELHQNVSQRLPGYELGDSHGAVLDALSAIIAQEQLHALTANAALQSAGHLPVKPCAYKFPISDFPAAITLASTFTAVVLGTLQNISQIFARQGDFALVRTISSVIGNEGEQEGFFRLLHGRRPSSQPFLTTSVRDFAFTAIQSFIEPQSCPDIDQIALKQFKSLVLRSTEISPQNQDLRFSFTKRDIGSHDQSQLRLVLINQQSVPVIGPLSRIEAQGEDIFFEAFFPFEEYQLSGLTIAAVTQGEGPFADASAVAEATIFGPAFIMVD